MNPGLEPRGAISISTSTRKIPAATHKNRGISTARSKRQRKLRSDEHEGGDGTIYSAIDGQGSSTSLVQCDNAFRVIKYVGILGYRYKSYNLVNMRIHDINLEVDLNAQGPDPPEPDEAVDCDGTAFQNPDLDPLVDATIDGASATTSSWWTGPWPLLHIRTEQSLLTGSYCFEISIDILGAFSVKDFQIWVPELDGGT